MSVHLEPRSAYIAFEVFPRPKGASSHMASMVKALCLDHGPVVMLCLGFGDMPAFQQEGDILIERCKIYHPNMLKRSQEFSEFVARKLDQWRDTLELCVFRDPWGGIPALFSGHRYKTLFEVNALPSWELGYTYPAFAGNHSLKHKIMDLEYACLDHSDRVLTVSRVTAKALVNKGLGQEKITIIPNSAPEVFFNAPSPETSVEGMGEGRWIAYVGSLHPWQGVENAIRAFSLIHTRFPDVNMLIVTGGRKEIRKQIRKLIRKLGLEDRVVIKLPLPHRDLVHVLRHCEFTLAPLVDTPRNTRQGCCPIKVIESMALGVCVIGSNLASVRDLIEHGHDGWLVPPGQIRDLALAMDRLLKDRPLTASLAREAAQKARRDFHPHKIHRDLSRCFAATINPKGASYGT
ncbi:MAG: glycosyltransferase family 4 protein [Proteobacteria bacterium]|nr:glycosyltransferase family 4 protein [Pseudomonadota bacterium]